MARPLQLALPAPRTWGGRRRGAGRAVTPGRRPGVSHQRRPEHRASNPAHVTLRATSAIGCLRTGTVFPVVRRALAESSRRRFRVIQFSVQKDHVHLIVEADDRLRLVAGVRGLAIRVARAVNRVLGRRGRVWGDRYHARALTTPRAVRHALVYVLMNHRKHHAEDTAVDPRSSARWFDGWRESVEPIAGVRPVARARTWLAAVGWRRHGLLSFAERRGAPRGDR